MSIANILAALLPAAAGGGGFYEIDTAAEFKAASSQHLTRTFGAGGNRRLWGLRYLVRRTRLGVDYDGCAFGVSGKYASFRYGGGAGNDTLELYDNDKYIASLAVFRDTSAWLDILWVWDTTNSTASERIRLYVNGVRQTALTRSSYPVMNEEGVFNSATAHEIGRYNGTTYTDGCFADIHFIDNRAPEPTDFGEFNVSGKWHPKRYSGSYGTTGFHLDFANSGALGADVSGLGNNWTPVNAPVQTLDTPTNIYARLDATNMGYPSQPPRDAALVYQCTSPNTYDIKASIAVSSGKWYWEITNLPVGDNSWCYGIMRANAPINATYQLRGVNGVAYSYNGTKWLFGVNSAYGAAHALNDVLGFALDCDAGTLTCYKNGVSQGAISIGVDTWVPTLGNAGGYYTARCNFGDKGTFVYTPPTGFKALCTKNLPPPPIPDPGQHHDNAIYTGNGAAKSVASLVFAPGLVWIKDRTQNNHHGLFDTLRGAGKGIYSSLTNVEVTDNAFVSFDAHGFSLNGAGAGIAMNTNGSNFAAWCWGGMTTMTGPEIAALVAATGATITPTGVARNVAAGFAVVTYTGNGAAGAAVPNPLGVIPGMTILKRRDGAYDWKVTHASIAAGNVLYLNLTNAASADSQAITSVSASILRMAAAGVANNANGGTYVVYVFAEVPAFSAFGSYTGTGLADGPRIILPFRPAMLMVKVASGGTGDWRIYDDARDPFNPTCRELCPNLAAAENVGGGIIDLDFLSNGFKWRDSGGSINNPGLTYIYAAFARYPYGGGKVPPVPAR